MVCGNATVELRTRVGEIMVYATLKVVQCSRVSIDGMRSEDRDNGGVL